MGGGYICLIFLLGTVTFAQNAQMYDGCKYDGKHYKVGAVVWQNPTCECTRMICQEDGQVHMVQKEKPCCIYQDRPYGNNEVVYTERCYQILCHKGELVSVPHCPDNFTVLQYNGVASCYHVSKDNYNRWDAGDYCKKRKSNLAVVSSKGENHALEDYLFFNQLHGGCKYGWLEAGNRNDYLTWNTGILNGMPVSSIYDDFGDHYKNCSGYLNGSTYLGIYYTGSQASNNYNWDCTNDMEQRNAICETCVTCEHRYSEVCLDCGKIYDNGEVIKKETEIAPCYEKICNHGKVQKKAIACNVYGSPTDTTGPPQ